MEIQKKKNSEFLKVLRREKELTQEQLAEVLHVSGRSVPDGKREAYARSEHSYSNS